MNQILLKYYFIKNKLQLTIVMFAKKKLHFKRTIFYKKPISDSLYHIESNN